MIEECLKFELQDELINHVVIFDCILGDFFYCEQPASGFVNGLIDNSKLALPQAFPQYEIIDLNILDFLIF